MFQTYSDHTFQTSPVVSLIGHTPLTRPTRVTGGLFPTTALYVKLEGFNPAMKNTRAEEGA